MTGATVLVADDDRAIRTVLNHALGRLGHEVRTTGDLATLWRWVENGEGNLVVTDVVMPDEYGLDLIPRIKKLRPDLRIIVISAQNTLMTAVKANERGAFEYLPKPFDLNELTNVVQRALNVPKSQAFAAPESRPELAPDEGQKLIGRSPAMQEIYRILARVMGTDLPIIISGESGTGKELIALALHQHGKRQSNPFIVINMAAIPRDLIESELFGHEKGSFTDADARVMGRFEQADGGTLFLDEIGDMPIEAQTRLLRVLQEGEYMRVGGREAVRSNVRIIAATHRDLRRLVQQGLFREDLFYRLNVVPIRIPPLRERAEDIPEFVRYYLAQAANEGLPAKSLDETAMARLKRAHWRGNVRELENLVRRLAVLCAEDVIGLDAVEAQLSQTDFSGNGATDAEADGLRGMMDRHLQEYFSALGGDTPAPGLYDRVLRKIERPLISATLAATRGNQIKAARVLGLNRNTLRKKIRDLDIQVVRSLK